MAIHDPDGFKAVCDQKEALASGARRRLMPNGPVGSVAGMRIGFDRSLAEKLKKGPCDPFFVPTFLFSIPSASYVASRLSLVARCSRC